MRIWINKQLSPDLDEFLSSQGIITHDLIPDEVVEHEDKVIIPVKPRGESFVFYDYWKWAKMNKEVDFVFVWYDPDNFSKLEFYYEVCLNSPNGEYIIFNTRYCDELLDTLRPMVEEQLSTFEKLFLLIR